MSKQEIFTPTLPSDLIPVTDTLERFLKGKWLPSISCRPCEKKNIWRFLLSDPQHSRIRRRPNLFFQPSKEDIILIDIKELPPFLREITSTESLLNRGFLKVENNKFLVFKTTLEYYNGQDYT